MCFGENTSAVLKREVIYWASKCSVLGTGFAKLDRAVPAFRAKSSWGRSFIPTSMVSLWRPKEQLIFSLVIGWCFREGFGERLTLELGFHRWVDSFQFGSTFQWEKTLSRKDTSAWENVVCLGVDKLWGYRLVKEKIFQEWETGSGSEHEGDWPVWWLFW